MIDESQEAVTREMWYLGQKHQSDQIKDLKIKLIKIIELVEKLYERRGQSIDK